MNNTNTILVALVIFVLGGFILYTSSDRWYMTGDAMGEMHEEIIEHHDDDERVASYEIYPGDVVTKIQKHENIILLDVRSPEEFEKMHLENALLVPIQELSAQSLADSGLGEDMKDREIYVYCRSGNRSQTAYNIMKSLGYTNVKSIAGGMIHWEEDEYPFTESGAYHGGMVTGENEMMIGDSNGPQITFDRTTHDFGVIPQYGGTVETGFTITNTGEEALEIGDITTSCSCTSARVANTSVLPGNSTVLTVVFDPNFHEEPLDIFKRTVFIPTNDPQQAEAEVSISVDIAEGQ